MEVALFSSTTVLTTRSECLTELQIDHHKEPRNRHTETNNRPDIVLFDLETGENKELDIAMGRRQREWSHSSSKRFLKHSRERLPGGSSLLFTPLTFEDFGRWDVEADNLSLLTSPRTLKEEGIWHSL